MKNIKLMLLQKKEMIRILNSIKHLLNSKVDFLKTIDYLEKHT